MHALTGAPQEALAHYRTHEDARRWAEQFNTLSIDDRIELLFYMTAGNSQMLANLLMEGGNDAAPN